MIRYAEPDVLLPVVAAGLVLRLQQRLQALGFDPGTPDGAFGPHTAAAVHAFQLTQGLVADGEAGTATLKALGLK